MLLSDEQKAILRKRPHQTKLKMSVYQPSTIFACQVNDANIEKGARTIAYDGVTTGSYTDVDSGFLALIGTSYGESDLGTVRVRSADASEITVAENSDISWTDGAYISVLQYIAVEAVYPRIIQNPNTSTDVIFYKDYDVTYTDQNEVLGTLVCMGSHRAADMKNGSASLYWSSSGTYNVKGDSLTYVWEFEGGSPAIYSGTTPGYVDYYTAGEYLTKLTVSNSSGGEDIGYRYVSIHDATNPSISSFEIESLEGNRDSGGYSAKAILHGIIPDILPNAVVVLYADDYYGDEHVSLGGNNDNDPSIVFSGHILNDTIEYDHLTNQTSFTIGTINEVMKAADGFSISVESVASPAAWYELEDLTISKALYHYLRWQTTILFTNDFRYTWEDRYHQYFDTERASLYDSLKTFLSNSIAGELTSDRLSGLWAERSAGATHNSETAITKVFDISKRDWLGTPNIQERTMNDVSYYELGGIAYGGISSGSSVALMGSAPGNSPSYRGQPVRQQGLILTSQDDLNQLSGDLFAYKNSRYNQIDLQLVGNYRNFDIAPLERIGMNIEDGDTNKGIIMDDEPFHISSMSLPFDSENMYMGTVIALKQLVNGVDGDTIDIIYPEDTNASPTPYNYLPFPLFPFPLTSGSAPPEFLTTTPYPFDEETEIICPIDTSYPGNYRGIGLKGTQYSNSKKTFFSQFPSWVRSSSHIHPTYLDVFGRFESLDSSTGAYEEDTSDTSWYNLYGLNALGGKILLADKSPLGLDTQKRRFSFDPTESVHISGYEMVLDDNEPVIVSGTATAFGGFYLTLNYHDYSFDVSNRGMTFTSTSSWNRRAYFGAQPGINTDWFLDASIPYGYFDVTWNVDISSAYNSYAFRIKNSYSGQASYYTLSGELSAWKIAGVSPTISSFSADHDIEIPGGTTSIIDITVNIVPRASHRVVYSGMGVYNYCTVQR